ncbi:transposable element Tcb1 transposase [Trichonephila clavipes]|nr:transposable element Tcb1 transposase [Trichonephila clavipes]
MDWPAYSPDLNPIEHVWDMLSRRIAAHQPPPTCLPELRKALHEWCNIPQDQVDNLILSMPRRCKDEVEKLAYQLNEEAEQTERPIRRLSKVMYGRTCADMQVDVMGECLSSIKHVVGTTSGCFTRGGIIGKLEESRSVTSVAAEFGIAHSIVSRLWRQFQTTGTAIRGFSSGRPRGTTPANHRYIVLQAGINRRQTVGEIARHTTQATGRPIYRVLPGSEDCTVVVCLHDALYGVYL